MLIGGEFFLDYEFTFVGYNSAKDKREYISQVAFELEREYFREIMASKHPAIFYYTIDSLIHLQEPDPFDQKQFDAKIKANNFIKLLNKQDE